MIMAMTEERTRGLKKTALGALVGMIAGAGAMTLFLNAAGDSLLDAMGGSRIALAGVGIVYLLVGLFVAFGVAAPGAGARVLNVADAEELCDGRSSLLFSSLTMGLLGLVLSLLAIARGPDFPDGPVPAGVAIAALVLLLAAGGWMVVRYDSLVDELNHQLGLEGAAWAFGLSWLALTLWAAADMLGFGARLTAVDAVTVPAAMLLVGSFVAIGRRGMMVR